MGLFSRFKDSPADLAALQFVPGAPQLNQTGGFFGRGAPVQPVAIPPAPGGAPPPQGGKKPSFGRVLDGVLGGQTITEVKDAYRAQQAAAQRKAALDGLAKQVITDPREMMVYQTDPDGWAKANASRLEAYTLTPGAKRGIGGQGIDYAPQQYEMGDDLIQTDANGGAHSIHKRDPTFAEKTTAEKVQAEIKNMADRLGIDAAQLVEMIRSHKANESIGQGNLGMRGREFEARKAAGGFGTPGVGGGVIGPTLDPNEWEPVR